MNNYTPILKKPIIIKNCVTPFFLEGFRKKIENTKGWHFLYPYNVDFKNKFPKLILDGSTPELAFLFGLAFSLFLSIFEKEGYKYFTPEIKFCGVSIKDKCITENLHQDHIGNDPYANIPILKILGILNSDWGSECGGGFIWGKQSFNLNFGDFIIFDPKVLHSNSKVLCDKKRIAIDFAVPAKI